MSQPAAHGSSTGQANPPGKVGYGKPPRQHQFKNGVSGNSKGRPRKKPAEPDLARLELCAVTAAELGRILSVRENGKVRKVTVMQAILRNLSNQALKGDREASRILLQHSRMVDQGSRKDRQRSFDRQVDYKHRTAESIRRCDAMGLEPPDPVPHPDDMQVDSKRQRVIIIGPADDFEKKEWDESQARRQELIEIISDLTKVLGGPKQELQPCRGPRKRILQLLEEATRELAALDAVHPSEKQRRRGRTHERRRKPKTDVAAAACGGHATTLEKMQSCIEQAEEMLPDLEHRLCTRSVSDRPVYTKAVVNDVPDAERDSIIAERQELTKAVSYLEKQLRVPEEDLDPQFETSLDVAFLHKEKIERLHEVDELYPDAKLWQQSASRGKKRKKQRATGSDPPTLH